MLYSSELLGKNRGMLGFLIVDIDLVRMYCVILLRFLVCDLCVGYASSTIYLLNKLRFTIH